MSTAININNVTQSVGKGKLKNINFSVNKGEVFSIFGSSGCGKTTLLKMISGLMRPQSGKITVFGIEPTHFNKDNRTVATVWQSRALFPHLSVKENIMYGLRFKNDLRIEKEKKYTEIVSLLKIGYLQNRGTQKLSGGEEQKIALARALVIEPKVLLLDEPFTGIDRLYKDKLKEDLRELLQQVNCTFVFVSHDTDDIYSLSNRIAVIENHSVTQVATPQDLYNFPGTRFIAESIGNYTIIPGNITEVYSHKNRACVRTPAGVYVGITDSKERVQVGDKVSYAIRPGACSINSNRNMQAQVQLVGQEVKGETCQLVLKLFDRCNIRLSTNVRVADALLQQANQTSNTLQLSWNDHDALILKH